ncbi:MAG: AAA family ATPase, partial [Pseudomonadota bacterium]
MRYSFADCVLDTDRRELRRAGRVVATRPKVYQVLSYLVEQRDRVVSKDELLSECWPGRVVGDATLNSVLKEIRRAVGDSGKTQRFLKTLHGQGYRFVAKLGDSPSQAAEPGSPPAGSPPIETAPPSQSEHKQVTVLACRIDDSGRLAEELGPERMDALMRAFFATATRVLTRYGGSVTQWEGDGFTALFGAPRALEDHARRAAAAVIELRAALASGEQLPGVRLGAGLHTGPVVVGNLHDTEQLYTALGATTTIAHGIRRQAGPAIVASAALHGLIESEVSGRPLAGPKDLPALFEITELAAQHGGVPRRAAASLNRFVGRGDEVALAMTRLELAQAGSGNAVCVSGEPGIGKSRLLRELGRRFDGKTLTRVAVNCLAYRQPSPWFVIQQVLRGLCGLCPDDDAAAIVQQLGARAAAAGLETPGIDTLQAVFETPGDLDLEALHAVNADQVIADVNRLLLHAALQQPLVVVLEDLHWIDATSERWLAAFVQRLPTAPVLLLAT